MSRQEKLVIAGVSGCGKSTIGETLADRLGAVFLDADDFHPPENVAKMKAGTPLDDTDRAGWLAALGVEIARREPPLVVACSALKKAYRDRLREFEPGLRFILLTVDPEEIRRRMEIRARDEGHFMPPALLDSQLATLETGDDMTTVTNSGPPVEVVDRILAA